jgi:hypothetical protein
MDEIPGWPVRGAFGRYEGASEGSRAFTHCTNELATFELGV